MHVKSWSNGGQSRFFTQLAQRVRSAYQKQSGQVKTAVRKQTSACKFIQFPLSVYFKWAVFQRSNNSTLIGCQTLRNLSTSNRCLSAFHGILYVKDNSKMLNQEPAWERKFLGQLMVSKMRLGIWLSGSGLLSMPKTLSIAQTRTYIHTSNTASKCKAVLTSRENW